ncbi:MAG: formylglycine-generating enzyme family protein [Prevotellaceae bacterium]|nr:formylglycine-generating enzyme family protein [Prevotellaceae bacterium]
MVFVQGGTFWMGCSSEQDDDCSNNEKPVHRVNLNDFYISKHEVTQAQWKALMGTNPSNFEGDNLPIENVSWDDAQIFIKCLNDATGKKFRLPTEAEWEYSARGGSKSEQYKYSGSNFAEQVAWSYGNSDSSTHPVGTKEANELGICDMSGNLWEWCYDWYTAYSSLAQNNPTGALSGHSRVVRGGGWGNGARSCRVATRSGISPGSNFVNVGFRVACSSE